MTPRPALHLPAGLRAEIHACGYFPELVSDAVALALGPEEPVAHLVQLEATFNRDEIQRHMSVLVLTASRLIVAHTESRKAAHGRPSLYDQPMSRRRAHSSITG